MSDNWLDVSPATATGARVGVDIIALLGTSTDVAVQAVKTGFGTDNAYTWVSTIDPFPVTNAGTATQPVSVGTWTATGQVLTAALATATQPVSVGTWTATGAVNVSLASATQPVSLLTLPTTATLPVTVATDRIFSVAVQNATATIPVSVGVWTATGAVTVQNTATSSLNALVTPFKLRGSGTQIFITVSATGVATIATGGAANTFRDMVWMTLSNNATTGVQVLVKDTSTATFGRYHLAADGGGISFAPFSPSEQSVAATGWLVQLASSVVGQVNISAKFINVT